MNSNKKIVLGITGIRSEYDILSSVFRAISKHDDLLLKVAVTGAHLSESFGHTIDEIESDGFKIVDCIESLLASQILMQKGATHACFSGSHSDYNLDASNVSKL